MEKKPELSIVILNYNTKELLKKCLESIERFKEEVPLEIIISDNSSTDGSVEMLKEEFPAIPVYIGPNVGFSKGNNRVRKVVKGRVVLFLNPDTELNKGVLKETCGYLKSDEKIGAVGCKEVLPDGSLDKDARRAFPTPWVGFTHLVLRLDRIFPKSKLFSQYWYGYKSDTDIQEVDAIQGAFMLIKKDVLDQVGWFDEDYSFNGEDIDLCWRIKEAGYKIIYYPKVEILHVKGAAKGKSKAWKHKVPLKDRLKMRSKELDAMAIFYKKHLWNKYPLVLNLLVIFGIKVFKVIRIVGIVLSG
jgi:GT2 family glycosyltransferase